MSCGCGGGSVNRTIQEARDAAIEAQARADEQRRLQGETLVSSAENAMANASSDS